MSDLTQAMQEYANAIRGDWSDFDGRSERNVIESWIAEIENPDPARTIGYWRAALGLCLDGNGHWYGPWGNCNRENCPTYAAEVAEREAKS